jgi:DNA-binding transcriptional regulator YiaG
MEKGWEFLMLTPGRIKAARLGLGLSQPQFAAWIGKRGKLAPPSLSVVSRWERGVRRPGRVYGPLILQAEKEAREHGRD